MDSRSKILFVIFVVFVILSSSTSYYRFVVLDDYLVSYEGECDPYEQICFIGCEDDECTSEYYYSQVEKYAPNVFEQCGEDITDCENAYVCLPEDDEKCNITFCNPEFNDDACEKLTGEDYIVKKDDSGKYSNTASDDEGTQDTGEDTIETEGLNIDEPNEVIESI